MSTPIQSSGELHPESLLSRKPFRSMAWFILGLTVLALIFLPPILGSGLPFVSPLRVGSAVIVGLAGMILVGRVMRVLGHGPVLATAMAFASAGVWLSAGMLQQVLSGDPGFPQPVIRPANFRWALGILGSVAVIVTLWTIGSRRRLIDAG